MANKAVEPEPRPGSEPFAASSVNSATRSPSLERHRRKCTVCKHAERDAIEEAFLHWMSPEFITEEFELPDWSTLYAMPMPPASSLSAVGTFASLSKTLSNAPLKLKSPPPAWSAHTPASPIRANGSSQLRASSSLAVPPLPAASRSRRPPPHPGQKRRQSPC